MKKAIGILVAAIFLVSLAGAATAASLDLPKWVIIPEDSSFSDTVLFCGLDAMEVTNNVTPCYLSGTLTNATIVFDTTTGYPKLVTGKIGNAFEFDGNGDYVSVPNSQALNMTSYTVSLWIRPESFVDPVTGYPSHWIFKDQYIAVVTTSTGHVNVRTQDVAGNIVSIYSEQKLSLNEWYMITYTVTADGTISLYINGQLDESATFSSPPTPNDAPLTIGGTDSGTRDAVGAIDEVRIYNRALSPDEIKLLYLAGRKKLGSPANFRQIFSPLIDLTRDRATFYAGLEVSTSDRAAYVPVPESATNMSITSAPKLTSDYTGAPFYYEGHYWYQAQNIQYNLPIQFETLREDGGFSKEIILDDAKKTFVYQKEFRVTNPTGARINVVYTVDPAALGFSLIQYPQFELDGVNMAEWRPSNSTGLYLIRTDSLEPGEISIHWIKSIWTLTKEELEFPAKLDDFRAIRDWQAAQKMAENAVKGKTDTYVRVIRIDSNADVSNVTILVPLKDVEDESDVIEATALTGARDTLQVEKLEDGKVVVKVPSQDFVSGHAEIKVLYNKSSGSWLSRLLEMIRSLFAKIFGFGGG